MTLARPVAGKVRPRLLEELVYKQLGRKRSEVSIGPRSGVDTSAIRLGNGKVLLTTTDPLSLIPAIGPSESAWMSAHLLASDLATTGLEPKYGAFDFNLPPSMKDSSFEEYWKSFHKTCKELGLAIIGGHTGRYDGCDYTIIGGGVMMTIGFEGGFLTSAMGGPGDDLILTKGAAIESTAVLTRTYPHRVRKALGDRLFDRAWQYLRKVTVVKDALTAASVGINDKGVTAMHDATEGGVIAASIELARASETGLILDLEAIELSQETNEVCKLFQINPLISLSEGSLIIASRPSATSRVIQRLLSKGILADVVGRLVLQERGYHYASKATTSRLSPPSVDPYWKAFETAHRRGWN